MGVDRREEATVTRRISLRQAQLCETACGPRCKCRCGGIFHGMKRSSEDAFFEALPADDPHHALGPEAAKQARRLARRALRPQLELFPE